MTERDRILKGCLNAIAREPTNPQAIIEAVSLLLTAVICASRETEPGLDDALSMAQAGCDAMCDYLDKIKEQNP